MELARSGADIAAVVSFHGSLGTSLPAKSGVVKTSLLVLNGADDRNTSADDIAAFQKEMNAAAVDWQFVNFSGAAHCLRIWPRRRLIAKRVAPTLRQTRTQRRQVKR